jgi:hypothetical protein
VAPWFDINDDRIKATYVVWYLAHPVIAQAVVRSLRCVDVPGTGTSYLADNPEVDCSSASYKRYVPVAACYGVFYVIGFIVYLLVHIYWYAADIVAGQHGEYWGVGKRFIFFIRGYTRAHYLWEFAIVFRKLGVVVADALLPPDVQLVWAALIIGPSLSLTISLRPYESVVANFLDSMALSALFFTIILGLHQRLLPDPNPVAVTVLLISINSAVGMVVIVAMFRASQHILEVPVLWIRRKINTYIAENKEYELNKMDSNYIPEGVVMRSRENAVGKGGGLEMMMDGVK